MVGDVQPEISKVVIAFKQIRQCKNLRFELLQCLVRLLVLLLQRIKLLWVGIEYRRDFFQFADGAAAAVNVGAVGGAGAHAAA